MSTSLSLTRTATRPDNIITGSERNGTLFPPAMNEEVCVRLPTGTCVLRPIHERAIRIRFVPDDARPEARSVAIVSPALPVFTKEETDLDVVVATSHIKAVLHTQNGALSFHDSTGNLLLREVPGSRNLFPGSAQGEPCYEVEQSFFSPAGEQIRGLGQFQDGQSNLRGISRRLVQVNTQIAIPFFISDRGYGLLWHQYGQTDFNPADNRAHLIKDGSEGPAYSITVTGSTGEFTERCQACIYNGEVEIPAEGEYTFFLDYGEMTHRHELEIDGVPVIRQENYWLPPTANARVRLSTGRHRLKAVAVRGEPKVSWRAPADVTTLRSPHAEALDYVVFAGPRADDIVAALQNVTGNAPLLPRWAYGFWQSRERYASQAEILDTAREHRKRGLPLDVMVQDWQYWPKDQWGAMQFDKTRYPNPAGMIRELREMKLQLVVSVWENVGKDSEVGKAYEASNCYIPDSPWLDMANPKARAAHWEAMNRNLNAHGVSGWWLDATEPENDALAGKMTHLGPGEFHRLTYPLHTSQAVFEGQRKSTPERRVCILTRSAFTGQQRYGSIAWSGDVGWDWDAFRRQIVAGLNYSASGMPYWTSDIGGFFRPPNQYTDPTYHEILTRWFQFGAFCPIFRIHGFGTETEVWRFGSQFEAAARRMLDLRYRLLPYIYSLAWQVTRHGRIILRPLLMDFPDDADAVSRPYQYMFGQAILVCPVTEPGVDYIPVRLPGGSNWYDLWTGKRETGGQNIMAESPLDKIPLFVREGSILPFGPSLQHTGEKSDPIELRIYAGADAAFDLYEDAGDTYGYERGEYSIIPMRWNDDARTLLIGARQGAYPGMPVRRIFSVNIVTDITAVGSTPGSILLYEGTEAILWVP